nr:hypothetical protein [uncultured Flavobacterium sp.]
MYLATRKYNLIQKIFEVNESVFEELEKIINKTEGAQPISLQQYNKELNQANSRIENGDFYTAEDVAKMASQW